MMRTEDNMIKYYVYDEPNMSSSEGTEFDDYQEAIDYAIENGCYEVEAMIWNDIADYKNYAPADDYKIVYRKEN